VKTRDYLEDRSAEGVNCCGCLDAGMLVHGERIGLDNSCESGARTMILVGDDLSVPVSTQQDPV